MTGLRAVLVRRPTLAGFARQMLLGQFLLMGHGEAETGGRQSSRTLCATFEAVVGALYLDQGLEAVENLVMPLVERALVEARIEAEDKDPKSRLQELAQSVYGLTPRYRTIKAEGPDHAKAVHGAGIHRRLRLRRGRRAKQAVRRAACRRRRPVAEVRMARPGVAGFRPGDGVSPIPPQPGSPAAHKLFS